MAAQKSNINAESLLQCINSNRYKKLIQQDQQEAKKLGLTGTPGVVFINNKNNKTIVKQGALSYANLNKFIRSVTDHSILLTH
ncbi:DsbA family protein [Paraglaciecola aquimarina]|uniref:DsbA family protein n=1 Tax=Paraglaciecola aquimarina TaxID=1235557 RepID=UPI003D1825E8